MNQEQLNEYFATKWKSNLDQYLYSGWSLINNIAENELVLDVGCGPNPFKGKIKNLIGIDPAYDEADYKVTINEFKTNQKFDVAFCLGSINFGTSDKIISEISSVVKLLNPTARIYWRSNPGRKDHVNKECESIDFFPWTFEIHQKFSKAFGFECIDLRWDSNHRIYAEWSRM
jgi:hypothetical protein